ncbi:hypothetical protein EV715DRAFT_255200 [Schizophyllum commune]
MPTSTFSSRLRSDSTSSRYSTVSTPTSATRPRRVFSPSIRGPDGSPSPSSSSRFASPVPRPSTRNTSGEFVRPKAPSDRLSDRLPASSSPSLRLRSPTPLTSNAPRLAPSPSPSARSATRTATPSGLGNGLRVRVDRNITPRGLSSSVPVDKRTVRFADELDDEDDHTDLASPPMTPASAPVRVPKLTGGLFSRSEPRPVTPLRSQSDDFRPSSRNGSPFLESWLEDASYSGTSQRSASISSMSSLSRVSTARTRGDYTPLTVENLSSCSLDAETRHARRLSADSSVSITSDESDGSLESASLASFSAPKLASPPKLVQCQECRISLLDGEHHFIVEVNIAVTLCSNPRCLSRWCCKLCGYSRFPCDHVTNPPDDLDDTIHAPLTA